MEGGKGRQKRGHWAPHQEDAFETIKRAKKLKKERKEQARM